MMFRDLLVEFDFTKTVRTYEKKLKDRFDYKSQEPSEWYDNMERLRRFIRKTDPTGSSQKYGRWLVHVFVNSPGWELPALMAAINPVLQKYHTLKKRRQLPRELADIMRWGDFEKWQPAVDGLWDRVESLPIAKRESDMWKVGKDLVVRPKSRKAAGYWGRHSKFCTSSSASDTYYCNNYSPNHGDLYLFIPHYDEAAFAAWDGTDSIDHWWGDRLQVFIPNDMDDTDEISAQYAHATREVPFDQISDSREWKAIQKVAKIDLESLMPLDLRGVLDVLKWGNDEYFEILQNVIRDGELDVQVVTSFLMVSVDEALLNAGKRPIANTELSDDVWDYFDEYLFQRMKGPIWDLRDYLADFGPKELRHYGLGTDNSQANLKKALQLIDRGARKKEKKLLYWPKNYGVPYLLEWVLRHTHTPAMALETAGLSDQRVLSQQVHHIGDIKQTARAIIRQYYSHSDRPFVDLQSLIDHIKDELRSFDVSAPRRHLDDPETMWAIGDSRHPDSRASLLGVF